MAVTAMWNSRAKMCAPRALEAARDLDHRQCRAQLAKAADKCSNPDLAECFAWSQHVPIAKALEKLSSTNVRRAAARDACGCFLVGERKRAAGTAPAPV